MAYTNENHLLKVIEIQSLVMQYKKKGVSQRWVYDNVINVPGSTYHISRSTFNNYMCMTAKAKLTELRKKNNKQKQ